MRAAVTSIETSHTAFEPRDAPAGVLDLILRRVKLRARRRAAWLAHLHGNADGGVHPVTSGLDDRDGADAEAAWARGDTPCRRWTAELESVEEWLAGEAGAPLRSVAETFGLSEAERDLLQAAIAVRLEPNLGAVFAQLQGHPGRGHLTELLAARLFDFGDGQPWCASSALALWGLVRSGEAAPGEPEALFADPQVIGWLRRDIRIDPPLVPILRQPAVREPLPSWPVDELVSVIRAAFERGQGLRFVVSGPPGSGRRTLAACVADRLGLQAVAIDTTAVTEADWPEVYMLAQRLALVGSNVLIWHGAATERSWPGSVTPAPLQFIACDEEQAIPPCEGLVDRRLDMPAPSLVERRSLWARQVPSSAAWPPRDLESLASRYRLSVGDIVAVGRLAPASARQAAEMARAQTRVSLGDLGKLLDCPFAWDDLVITDSLREALSDFAFEGRERLAFWESGAARRLFPREVGLLGLMSGPPGTGKTMAAQVIAADLDLDLLRIDLATVVSKYIGETAKNLRRIFMRSARMNAVLLFDEADALFSKRTDVKDAHDRYANTDTNYLLQLMEDYQGIALLATNKKGNIDPAFSRRVRYVFDFPRPQRDERQQIWTRVVVGMAGSEVATTLEQPIEALAATLELSGAQIKNAVLTACFVARRRREGLGLPALIRGLERELAKEGRSIGPRERQRLMRHA